MKEMIFKKDFGNHKSIYYVLGYKQCDICSQNISSVGVLYCYYNKKNKDSGIMFLHLDCFEEDKERLTKGIQNIYYPLNFYSEHLKGFTPVVLKPFDLSISKSFESVFDFDIKNDEKVIDNTVYAFKEESIENATIGKPIEEIIMNDHKQLSDDEVYKLLQEHANAIPEIELKKQEKIKQLDSSD
jgi:hypothetical protein